MSVFSGGFESGNLSGFTYTVGSPTIVTSPVHSGGYAMRAAGITSFVAKEFNPINDVSFDTWVYIPAIPDNAFSQTTLMYIYDTTYGSWVEAGIRKTAQNYVEWILGAPNTLISIVAPNAVSAWHHLKIRRRMGVTDGLAELWVDEVLLISQPNLNIPTPAGAIRVGLPYSSITQTVYIDDLTVTAESAPPAQYMLNLSVSGQGTTNPVSGAYSYNIGATATITATPTSGWIFDHWVLNGTPYTTNPISIIMNASASLQAIFIQSSVNYTLTVQDPSGSGSITPATGTHSYLSGTVVTLTATPSSGYVFNHWIADGMNTGSANPSNIVMNANHIIQAVFIVIPPPPPPVTAIHGASTMSNCFKQGTASYQPNWASLLKDTLGLNCIRFFCGGEGDVWHTNMVNNPTTWHTNLMNLLNAIGNAGLRMTFYCLGDPWGGGLFRDPSYQGYTTTVAQAKAYIDQLAGNNPLGYNFITDPRIYVWSVSNECNLGTGTEEAITLNADGFWTIEILDYIRSKGGKTVVPYARFNGGWEAQFWGASPVLAGHVDYLETHLYGNYYLGTRFHKADGTYDWNAWEALMRNLLQQEIDHLGSFTKDQMILGEFGQWRGTGSDAGLTAWTFTDADRVEYYTRYFNMIKDLGIKNMVFHYAIEENAQYFTNFCRYGMITPVPDGIHFTGPAGQTYPGAEIIKANFLGIALPHALSVSANLTNLQFTVNGVNNTIPYLATLAEGVYTIIMPSNALVGADTYNFIGWQDGPTNPTRVINLISDTAIQAVYQLQPPPPPAKGNIEVHAHLDTTEVVASGTVVETGETFNTPATLPENPGNYTINVQVGTETKTQVATVVSDQTIRLDFQFSTPTPMSPIAPILIGGAIVVAIALSSRGKGKGRRG